MFKRRRPTHESTDGDFILQIDRGAYLLFSGKPQKGGASEIVRKIGERADSLAKEKVRRARIAAAAKEKLSA